MTTKPMIQFTYAGRQFQMDINRLSINEALEIQRRLDINVREYSDGLLYNNDPRALAAMVYLAHRRADVEIDWDALGHSNIFDLIVTCERVDFAVDSDGGDTAPGPADEPEPDADPGPAPDDNPAPTEPNTMPPAPDPGISEPDARWIEPHQLIPEPVS